MLACVDVHYEVGTARAACVVVEDWTSDTIRESATATVEDAASYAPGEFYRRELPSLLEVLNAVQAPISVVVVDGYVWLGPGRPGLGKHLYDALSGRVPVVGVAKTFFAGSLPEAVLRGESQRPLYVTAEGMEAAEAARHVAEMHGAWRIPTVLKAVDRLARDSSQP